MLQLRLSQTIWALGLISQVLCLRYTSRYHLHRSPRKSIDPRKHNTNDSPSFAAQLFDHILDVSYIPVSSSQLPSISTVSRSDVEGRNFILEKLCQLGLGEVSKVITDI